MTAAILGFTRKKRNASLPIQSGLTTNAVRDCETIWRAGLDAVRSDNLVAGVICCANNRLSILGHAVDLAAVGRIAVVGAGKAGAGMAAGCEKALGDALPADKAVGWVNVPDECVRPLKCIHLHPSRSSRVNEPTAQGVAGSDAILEIVSQLDENDVCLVLLSGGGSALLPAPVVGISLADKQQVTRLLMNAGATIDELNCVRKQLSRIKGGRLARACRAGLTVALIISDVVGDRLDVIASGPTVDDPSTPDEALAILHKYATAAATIPPAVVTFLEDARRQSVQKSSFPLTVRNHVIGNNALALAAAAEKARALGYRVQSLGSDNQGVARDVGRTLAEICLTLARAARPGDAPVCLLSGGEPVVHLVETDQPRSGGRNQELALAALDRLAAEPRDVVERITLLSGGTDGEDGPTDAAGAFADVAVLDAARSLGLDPATFLSINNSYALFARTGGLFKTGPTDTNVMDLRVATIG